MFLPRGKSIPASAQEIYRASVDLQHIGSHWEQIVHLIASVHFGRMSAVQVCRHASVIASQYAGHALRSSFLTNAATCVRRNFLSIMRRRDS